MKVVRVLFSVFGKFISLFMSSFKIRLICKELKEGIPSIHFAGKKIYLFCQ